MPDETLKTVNNMPDGQILINDRFKIKTVADKKRFIKRI